MSQKYYGTIPPKNQAFSNKINNQTTPNTYKVNQRVLNSQSAIKQRGANRMNSLGEPSALGTSVQNSFNKQQVINLKDSVNIGDVVDSPNQMGLQGEINLKGNTDQYNTNYQYSRPDSDSESKKCIGIDRWFQNSMNGFMRKVYIIVSIKLALTALICVMALKSEWFKNTFASVPFIVLLALLLVGLIIVMVCLPDFFKKFTMPISIVFIIVFALLISVICASAQSESILAAIVISAVAVIGLTIYSCFIKTDLTDYRVYLFVFVLIACAFGITCIFWKNPVVHLLYACLAALVFSIFIIFETQKITRMGSNTQDIKNAFFAAVYIYADLIHILVQAMCLCITSPRY